ncbi:TnsA endonuclease N-terminal domain-containing protein [Polaromonas sp. JS666]|uniref:TnsA endonuclease N-terminal domain-containing protein n=1 Tax=Polaromonas sp. (strain JS666 / ATCC BAA-500) TaxID=296591 RepID=UPI00088F4D9B|nr:TnsA endonuclease N-terminal domain-containing protein [Polaromonas sp. JS666]SDM42597.1 TnsA endonuclease N terminal [Polaromonas sp. JS666]
MDASQILSARGRKPLRPASAVRAAAAKRGKHAGNICYVYGEKTQSNWTLVSDLELANFLDLESDSSVKTYNLNTDRVIAQLGSEGYQGSKPDALVTYFSGMEEMREVKYQKDIDTDLRAQHQAEVQREAARKCGFQWRHYTEADAKANYCRIMNWLRIGGALREAKSHHTEPLEKTICAWLKDRPHVDLAQLNVAMGCEWRLSFVAIFRLFQRGRLDIDLSSGPLTWRTPLALRRKK